MERYLRSGEFRNVFYDNGILTSTIVLSDVNEGGVWGWGGGGGRLSIESHPVWSAVHTVIPAHKFDLFREALGPFQTRDQENANHVMMVLS